jgi:macrolide transport system ATP-binding/permease protein
MLLSIQGLSRAYGSIAVLDAVSFVLNAGERVGVVGANGAGKSTLLRLLVGEDTPDAGVITSAPAAAIGYLPQSQPSERADRTIAEAIRDAVGHLRQQEARMRELEAAMAAAVAEDKLPALLEEYGMVASRFQEGGGYELDHRIDAVLAGLRMDHLARTRRVASLSGGERARLGLAALLLRSPDVLLLDEPTNHLDIAALEWLEAYLARYTGGVLVVSHDRQFLDRTVNRIFEIDDNSHQLKRYEGDYSAYAQAKLAERAQWEEDYERQQEEIAALRRRMRETARLVGHPNRQPHDNDKFANHFFEERVQTTIQRNVRTAAELLRRIEADPIPKPPKPVRFNPRFDAQALRSSQVIHLADVRKRLGSREVLRGVSATVGPRARVVLTGPNGAGKTTLLRLILRLEVPDAGEARVAPGARLGYLPQEPALADLNQSVLQAYSQGLVGYEATFVAGLIGHGFFRLEDLDKSVGHLSSGQRRKLEIARLIAAEPNVLLLDEPTNYVSLDVLEAFETAVRAFPGPIVAVSHDRWFIQRFGGEVWELANGTLTRHAAGSAVSLDSVEA